MSEAFNIISGGQSSVIPTPYQTTPLQTGVCKGVKNESGMSQEWVRRVGH